MDLRNAGFKLAPVDTNLFPGGFNNLNPDFLPLCVQAAMAAIEKICPEAQRLLLIPENHTRNLFYLQNVARLAAILRQAGLNVRIGSLLPEITAPTTLDLPDGADTDAGAAQARRRPARRWTASIPAPSCSTTTCPPACRRSCKDLEQQVVAAAACRLGDAAQVAATSPPTTRSPRNSPS